MHSSTTAWRRWSASNHTSETRPVVLGPVRVAWLADRARLRFRPAASIDPGKVGPGLVDPIRTRVGLSGWAWFAG